MMAIGTIISSDLQFPERSLLVLRSIEPGRRLEGGCLNTLLKDR